MGTDIGEFAENTVLFEAACSRDPVLRLAGVNRALEGLAIDVFTTMKEFGDVAGDPVLEFCEDWMLADEVTHVKMGSDWLRRLTANDPERRKAALEFQQVVDKLFSYGGTRSRLRRVGRSAWPAASGSWPASATTRSTRSPRCRRQRSTRPRSTVSASAARRSPPGRRCDGPATGGARWRSRSRRRSSPSSSSTPPSSAPRSRSCSTGSGWPTGTSSSRSTSRSPIARVQVEAGDPLCCVAESGAFEDTRKPRQLSERRRRHRLGRMLLRLRDREAASRTRRPTTRSRCPRWRRGTPTRRAARPHGLRRQPPALALQLPQPARLHRRRRPRLRGSGTATT